MKFSSALFNVVTLFVTFSSVHSAHLRSLAADELAVAPVEVSEEAPVDTKDRELIIDPRCYDWCSGFATGYCRIKYPRCAPLLRHLAENEIVVAPSEVAEEAPVDTKDRELIIDPRCYDWCSGFATGYCRIKYPRCAPLLRHLADDEMVVAPSEGAEEAPVDTKDRELIIDPRCYDWCSGFATGYCRIKYPRCAPLLRHLADDEMVVAPEEVAEEAPVDTKDRELIIDPRCYDWCSGFATGYCRIKYPRCAPL